MIPDELMQSFIMEASDLLDDIEPSLIEYSRLGTPEERMEVVNRVFRHFHSIKGSAGFVCLDDISHITHEAETLLELYRRDAARIIPNSAINLLCRTVDIIRAQLAQESGDAARKEGSNLDAIITEIKGEISAIKKGRAGISVVNINAEEKAATEPADGMPADSPRIPENPTRILDKPKTTRISNPNPTPSSDKPVGKVSGQAGKDKTRERTSQHVVRTKTATHDTARIIRAARSPSANKMDTSEFAGKYVAEANELLEQIEQALLNAEQHPDEYADSIQDALRYLHSFKGNSGFMNLSDLERLSHRMESEVEKSNSLSIGLESQVFDALLQLIDSLRQGVLDFSCGGTGKILEADEYIAMLDSLSEKQAGKNQENQGQSINRSGTVDVDLSAMANLLPETSVLPDTSNRTAPEKKGDAENAAIGTIASPDDGNTTRVLLVGNASSLENLTELPKMDSIFINPLPALSGDGPPPLQSPATQLEMNSDIPQPRQSDRATAVSSFGKPVASFARQTSMQTIKPREKDGPVANAAKKRNSSDQAAGRNDIRVDLRKLDGMLDLVGELVIAEEMVTRHPVVWNAENESLERAVHQLRRVTNSLQDMATSVRMIPLAPTFRRMTRLVYDLSVKAGKQVDLILLGEDTEVDRTVIERISDPLVHIIRNAIDHGIEPPAVRVALGKSETGSITIEGHHEGGEVWVVVTDDGRGLDRDAILAKAISRGLVTNDGAELTDNQVFHFIFEPGFSTATKVTDISGRGFGMDVVKKNIEKLSGKIDIRTRMGEGTAVVMRIPLTLAIIDGMLVRSGDTRYIIPLLSIRESLKPDVSQIFSTPDGQQMVRIRNDLVPIVKLNETFSRVRASRDLVDGILMIVEGEEGEVVALFADELLGQQETVIKGLSGWLKHSRGVSGCTILGDGEVGLILDIGAIVKLARHSN
ncbi:MAG: chemotaxis protein CheA [Planctomycetota bacterium]|jgi:two-component system chemotaxis sensor kinase CheA|nr:chemotaxis protein CheA [Planctomycetota bacterium]